MWARVPAAIVGGIVTYFATDWAMGALEGNAGYVLAGVVFAVLATATLYIAFFHKKTGDMLIDTENEMRKVVWPDREEVAGSTIVVIGSVVLMGAAIFIMDIVLTQVLSIIGVY